MSHFYGTLQGNRGEATRCGSKKSGIATHAASWSGCVHARLYHNRAEDSTDASVCLDQWHGGGRFAQLYVGPVNPTPEELVRGLTASLELAQDRLARSRKATPCPVCGYEEGDQ